ncbi:MAG: signal peptidase I [Georgfuchsia sp.]
MNFALILFVLLVATGLLWAADHFIMSKRRKPGAPNPWWVEYGASFFPVILVVFFLRSFLVEPYKIPSGSMIPTLHIGDFILVNKYTYGIRLPVINKKIININTPRRGDVMVFRYPVNPSLDYIKRVVGLPGDRIAYFNKHLTINGKEVLQEKVEPYLGAGLFYTPRYQEQLGEVKHFILLDREVESPILPITRFTYRGDCHYNAEGVECVVPAGHYFMMGDNRDNSQDSRYWGFVPEENIVGKAFFIWFNFSDLKRIGSFK